MPYGMRPAEPRAIPAPPGTPYHRLARNYKHTWWRPLVGTLVVIGAALLASIGILIAWEIAHGLITGDVPEPQDTSFFPNPTEDIAINLALLAVLTPVVAFSAWLVQRRPAWSLASVLNRIRWRWLLLCCLPALGYIVLSYSLGLAADALFPTADSSTSDDGSWVGIGSFIVPALVILLLVPFQAAGEEFVFRGWLVQAIGAYGPDNTDGNTFTHRLKLVLRSPWPALVISSALFVTAHGYTGWAMADIFLFAMLMGWLTIRTGGLEAGIALHTVNNLAAFLVPAALGQLDGWADQGGAPWTLLATDIPCLAFYGAAIVWLAKRKQLARASG